MPVFLAGKREESPDLDTRFCPSGGCRDNFFRDPHAFSGTQEALGRITRTQKASRIMAVICHLNGKNKTSAKLSPLSTSKAPICCSEIGYAGVATQKAMIFQ